MAPGRFLAPSAWSSGFRPLSAKLWPTNRPTRSDGSSPSRLRKAQRTAPGWPTLTRAASMALGTT